ncbi:MAG: fibronectin type III domain-containing protein, partial [Thermodesulfovibrionia bacterium]|nr:fibronectin type III domain-containing protein [Thermodesulfovibrionia bacterium]
MQKKFLKVLSHFSKALILALIILFSFASSVFAVPSAPSNLTATAMSSSQINLSWMDNSNNETGFKIERKKGATGTYSQVATVGVNVTTYSNTGLLANTTYYYRVRAYNSGGNSAYSNEAVATTLPIPPTATTNPATNINGDSATLNATVNPNGSAATVYFEWGTTTSYGNSTPSQSIGSGTSNVNVASNLTGLSPNTTYYYRVIATNAGGTSYGYNMSFTTKNIIPPNIFTSFATNVASDSVTLNTIVNPNGSATSVSFEWWTDINNKNTTSSQSIGSGTSPVNVTANLTGLSTVTTYYYRVVATNVYGTSYGYDVSFTTNSPTYISGGIISTDTTWTKAGSPYIVTGN